MRYRLLHCCRLEQFNKGLYRNERLSAQLTAFVRCQLCLSILVLVSAAAVIYVYFFDAPLLWWTDTDQT